NLVSDMSDFKPIGGTVRARAATELRDRILTGRLRPGTRLDLDEITEEFGTSRTPVREALLELSYEGLVVVSPRTGITAVGIPPRGGRRQCGGARRPGGQGGGVGDGADHRRAARRAARARQGHRPGARRGRRQPALPPRGEPGIGLAPPAHLPPPSGARGAR